jgi:hypothetical protein
LSFIFSHDIESAWTVKNDVAHFGFQSLPGFQNTKDSVTGGGVYLTHSKINHPAKTRVNMEVKWTRHSLA